MSGLPTLAATVLSLSGGYLALVGDISAPLAWAGRLVETIETHGAAARGVGSPSSATGDKRSKSAEPGAYLTSRRSGGFFYADIALNGVATRFLVDTGTNTMVLRRADAELAGLPLLDTVNLRTAGGTIEANRTHVAQLSAGGQSIEDVEALVVGDHLGTSLIGTDALARLGSLKIDGDRLTIGPG